MNNNRVPLKVSIIIPVYNAEKYLKECLDSVLNQTYKNIEVISVYDKSEDRTLDILKEYSDRITIIDQQSGSVTSAINDGIKAMTGEWFKYIGADEILYPNAIEELISEAGKLEDKKKWIIASNYHIIDSEGRILRDFVEPNYNKMDVFDFNVNLLDHIIGAMPTSIIPKSALEDYGVFNENYVYAPDYELWLRYCLLHNVRIRIVPKFLIKYRVHKDQGTVRIPKKERTEEANNVRKYVFDMLDPVERQKYEIALRQYKKMKKPLLVKCRHALRDVMFKVLPQSVSKKIVVVYQSLKKEVD